VQCTLLAVLVALGVDAGSADAKGSGPTSITVRYGSVWIGMGNGDVLALPTSLDRVRRPIIGGMIGYVNDLRAGYGSVWILRGALTRLDPATGATRDVAGTASATVGLRTTARMRFSGSTRKA
jgi:hypothetical protein